MVLKSGSKGMLFEGGSHCSSEAAAVATLLRCYAERVVSLSKTRINARCR